MKSANILKGNDYIKNWKALALIIGIIFSTTLTSCSTTIPQGDAMKGDAMKGDAMKGDAMKGDAMKGDAMKGDAKKDKDGAAKDKSNATPTPKS